MKKRIHLELHREDNALLLEHQDIYDYVGETTEAEMELAHFVERYCAYLNWYVSGLHNTEMKFADSEYERLKGWLSGYCYGKKYETENYPNRVEIKTPKYLIVLDRPFEI